jgi:hypothetical protein
MKLPEEFKTKWVAALRSGEYKQCKNQLHANGGHCCLGVAEIVLGVKSTDKYVLKGEGIPIELSCYHSNEAVDLINELTEMNDSGISFLEIADYIEANL